MRNKRSSLQTTTLPSLQEVSNIGDIIEMDGEFYVYGGENELIHLEHYEGKDN